MRAQVPECEEAAVYQSAWSRTGKDRGGLAQPAIAEQTNAGAGRGY